MLVWPACQAQSTGSCALGCLASQMEPWLPTGPLFCPGGACHNLGQVLSRCERQADVLMTNSEVAISPDGAEMSFSGKLIFIGRLYSLDRFSSLLFKRCVKGLMVRSRVQSRTGEQGRRPPRGRFLDGTVACGVYSQLAARVGLWQTCLQPSECEISLGRHRKFVFAVCAVFETSAC